MQPKEQATATNSIHPLDPLNGEEIEAAAAAVRRHGGLSDLAWFETVALQEPEKQTAASAARRSAYVCCYDPARGETWEGVVDLEGGTLENWRHAEGAQARIVPDEFFMGGEIPKSDPKFIEACARRGITDMAEVLIEPWAAGHFAMKEEEGERMAYGHCWVRNEAGDNPYARPIANLHPVIDLRRRKLVRVDDYGVVPLPPENTSLVHPSPRRDLKPLHVDSTRRAELRGRWPSRALAEMAISGGLPHARRARPSRDRL